MDNNLLYSKAGVKTILLKNSLSANKKLGQNFLVDKNKIIQIVDSIDVAGKNVLEVGPGLGAMTVQLARTAKKVLAVEIDSGFIPVLGDVLTKNDVMPAIVSLDNISEFEQTSWDENNTVVIHGDILKISGDLISEVFGSDEFVVCANLPYYITTPIIMNLINSSAKISEMVFMMQKELGDRIDAVPGTKSYGSLTLAIQYYVDVEKVTTVSPTCFFPEPRVDSLVLRFRTKSEPPVKVSNPEFMFSLVRSSFAMRRKTLLNNLAGAYQNIDKADLVQAIKNSGIPEKERAERLTLEHFALLSDNIQKLLS